MFDPEIDSVFTLLIEQWNIAERRIKKAEFVAANNVVSSAIFELRYAGRKIVDSLLLLQTENWKADDTERQKILASLADATEDCVKAKHDAIDAILLFVASWFDRTERQSGLSEIQKYFPDYIEITGKIIDLQNRISESRGDRTVLRDTIYDGIESEGYDEVLALYEKMRQSEPRVQREIRAERRRTRILVWGTIVAVVVALLALGIGVLPYLGFPPK